MSLGTNNPGNRTHTHRRIKANLDNHYKLMTQFIAEGMTREDASKKAFHIVTGKRSARAKEVK